MPSSPAFFTTALISEGADLGLCQINFCMGVTCSGSWQSEGWNRAVEHVQHSSEDKITVHFINRDGDKLTAKGKPGDSLLDVVVNNNLDIDGFGACEGTLACSTCHLIFEDHIFEKLDAITDEEMDMLDLAYGLTETSRLGCQICLKKSMDNMTVRVPEAVADVRQSVDMSKNS
ncbi:adrenodoxin, mitochondrial isoform 2-T2 [Amazona ochrocephala]